MFEVAQTVWRDPEQVEVLLVARVVHARDDLRHAVALAGELADDQVVLVVAGDREDELRRARDAGRSSTCSSVASPSSDRCSNSSSSGSKRSRRCSISVTSWPIRSSERARFAPTLPPPATSAYIRRQPARRSCMRGPVRQRADRRLGRADDLQPALGVELGARRVEDADDDAARRRSASSRPGRSRCSCCRRSSRRRPRRRRRRRPARACSVSIPWPTTKPPASRRRGATSASSFSSTTVTSQPSAAKLARERGADAAAADDHERFTATKRSVSALLAGRPGGRRRPAPRRARCAARSRRSARRTRDWRRQRGDEPSTIRSAPRSPPRRRSPRRSSARGS